MSIFKRTHCEFRLGTDENYRSVPSDNSNHVQKVQIFPFQSIIIDYHHLLNILSFVVVLVVSIKFYLRETLKGNTAIWTAVSMFGLSIERPILDHHAKAHIHEIRRISWNPWNPADFMKSVKSGGFHEIRRISPWNQMFQQKLFWFYKVWGGFHEIRRISYGFHEIHRISWNPPDFIRISWNPPDFIRISWNPVDFTMKSDVSAKTLLILQGLGWISWNPLDFIWISWNPPDFIWISWNPPDFIRISWNLPDFMWNRKTFARNCNSMFTLFGLSIERPILDHHPKAHIHEIRWISPWNPADFMKSVKSGGFQVKSSGFHEIQQISGEIWQISWNPADFRWNPPQTL